MRAIVTVAHGGPEVHEYRTQHPDPQPGPGEVRIRVAATALNFHDIFTRRGMPGVKIQLPVIVGSDIAGVVESLGEGVDTRWLSQRVLIDPVLRDGDRFGMLGETIDGGRAEFVLVRESMLLPLPDTVSFESAAALPLAYGTAYRMLMVRGGIQKDERVLILGASGGVGVACLQLAKMIGAEVVACASRPDKLARLRALGADHVIDYVQTPFREAVKSLFGKPRITGGGGVDVAINFTGGDTLIDTQKCVRHGGRILCCGATAGFNLALDARYWWTFEHSMLGSDGWLKQDLATLLDLVASKRMQPMIDKILPLQAVNEAERLLENREVVGKVLLTP